MEADWKWSVAPARFVKLQIRIIEEMECNGVETAINVHSCTYYWGGGSCYWTERPSNYWQGQEVLGERSKIELLLDLDEGTLPGFKNRRRLGVLKEGWVANTAGLLMLSSQPAR